VLNCCRHGHPVSRSERSPQISSRLLAASPMLQRDMNMGTPCVLRSGASRVLQDCATVTRPPAMGFRPGPYPPLRPSGRSQIARAVTIRGSPALRSTFRYEVRNPATISIARSIQYRSNFPIAFAARCARTHLRGTNMRMPAKAPAPASSIEFERPARSSSCLRTTGRTRRASP
jgi:hypothetical protein